MSIGKKIALIVVALSLFIIITAASGIIQINRMSYRSEVMLSRSSLVEASWEIIADFAKVVMPANDYLIHGKKDEIKNFDALLAELKETITRWEDMLEHSKNHPEHRNEEMELVAHVKADLAEVEKTARDIFQLENPIGKPEGALMMEKMDAVADTVYGEINMILSLAREDMESAVRLNQKVQMEARLIFSGIILLFLFAGFGIAYKISSGISSNIQKLVIGTNSLARGDLSKRIAVKSKDELETLAEHFNAMAGKLKDAQDKVLHAEKLAAIGRLASAIGHELRNPLGIIKNAQYYVKSKIGGQDEKVTHHLEIMESEIANCSKIINDLLGFSRTRKPDTNPQDINSIVEESLASVKKPENVVVETGLTQPSTIPVDREQIRQVFINIIINAFQAMPKGGRLKISTKAQNDKLEIDFQDTGYGISKESLEKLFDPFFTTKARGIGLGLSVCKNIIQNHNGEISVNSKVGEGTVFSVKLPKEAGYV